MTACRTIADALQQASLLLHDAEVLEPQLVAQSLLAAALNCDRTHLIINFNRPLSPEEENRYDALLTRRARGEPLQYITGTQGFFGLEFEVTPDVLIPRPETELLVEEVIGLASELVSPVVVDIGTGSGCLAVALARELSRANVIGTDISSAALAVARRNIIRHNLGDRISLLGADLLSAFAPQPFADFIVSNPPYIAAHEVPGLQREVRDWEPRVALTDNGDGLSFFRKLIRQAPVYLKPGGHMLCEMGFTQAETVLALVEDEVWSASRVLDDLQGIPRCLVVGKRK